MSNSNGDMQVEVVLEGPALSLALKQLEDVDLYKYRYLLERLTNAQMRKDMYSTEVMRAQQDLVKLQREVATVVKTIEDKYHVDLNKVSLDDSGNFIPRR